MLESSNKFASRNGGERKSSATKQTPLQQQLHLAGLWERMDTEKAQPLNHS